DGCPEPLAGCCSGRAAQNSGVNATGLANPAPDAAFAAPYTPGRPLNDDQSGPQGDRALSLPPHPLWTEGVDVNLSRTLALAGFAAVPGLGAQAAGPVIVTAARAGDTHVRHSEGTAVELKGGRLLLVWTEFTKGEGDSDFFPARLVARTSGDGGRTWDGYQVV